MLREGLISTPLLRKTRVTDLSVGLKGVRENKEEKKKVTREGGNATRGSQGSVLILDSTHLWKKELDPES